MKKSHRWAVLATIALFLCFLISLAVAQGPGAAPATTAAQPAAGPRLALLDVTFIFKNHERFNAKMKDMKVDFQNAQKTLQAQRAEITRQINEELSQYNKGTPEYQRKEEQIANAQAKFAVALNRQKEEFLLREAQIYHETFQEVMRATDYFCRQHNIDMVLRFDSEKADPARPETVLADISKPVVWYDARWVITKFILDDLNRTPVNSQPTPGTPATARPVNPYNNATR